MVSATKAVCPVSVDFYPYFNFVVFPQVYVDQIHPDVHAITRHCPDKRRTVVLVAHSAFRHPSPELQPTKSHPAVTVHGIPALSIPGTVPV